MSGDINRPAVVILSQTHQALAQRIAAHCGGEVYGFRGRVHQADRFFDDVRTGLVTLFKEKRPLVAIMASGALIRLLADSLEDKLNEPPVLAVAEDGSAVVPLLGGHHGANDLAREIALALDGFAAITTAGDLRFGVALDQPPSGWVLANPQDAKSVMASLLNGEMVRLEGDLAPDADWLQNSALPFSNKGSVRLIVSRDPVQGDGQTLVFHRRDLILGIGCERGVEVEEVAGLAAQTLREANLPQSAVACVTSIDLKADEAAILALAEHWQVPARFFAAEKLEAETPRLQNPSDIVFAEVGCHGVAEGAALAAVGPAGDLVVPKQKSKRATVAVARADKSVDGAGVGRSRGHLSVVGIGPGSQDWRSPEVSHLVAAADDLVGYSLYLDLLEDLANGKKRHDFDLGKEEDRVRHAMELAGEGRNVALVCSGDAGIYAMATLVFELLQDGGLSDGARRISIQVSPGISALQAAAARAGAPLGHDFCTISLSDLLTPWPVIQTRVRTAAEGDFVIAFYNPVSRRRRTQLAYAKDVLLAHRPADTPVILATNLGRQGETVRIVPLCDLHIDDVDMLTVVIVGSSDSRTVATGDGRKWVYTPRGYAAKDGTKIGSVA